MEHNAPHFRSTFEGYYSKFDLPSGAHIALVICTVPQARKLPPHMVSFTYYPKNGSPIFQRELWVSDLQRIITSNSSNAFELRIPELGFMRCDADSTTTYDLTSEEFKFKATTRGRTPWNRSSQTPEGWLVYLPLPLHWHVHSLASPTDFELDIPSASLPLDDRQGEASVHQEKNWASSFPAAHMWVQGHSPSTKRSICLAGGKILGTTAFMVGYRSTGMNVDFVPPFSMTIPFFDLSPWMDVVVDWDNRAFALTIAGLWRKIEVKARAPKDEKTWFGLGSPFPEGHRRNYCLESFLATVEVRVWERTLWDWSWVKKADDVFEHASLEFAGGFYPERGEKSQ